MNKIIPVFLIFVCINMLSDEVKAQYEEDIHFEILFSESSFETAQVKSDQVINPVSWLVDNGEIRVTYGGEEFIESAGGAYPPQLEKYFEEIRNTARITVFGVNENGSVVSEESERFEFTGVRMHISRVLDSNRLGSVFELFLRESESELSENLNSVMFDSGGPLVSRGMAVSSMQEVQRMAAEMGRNAINESRNSGIESPFVFIVMFTPDANRFEHQIYPGTNVFFPVRK